MTTPAIWYFDILSPHVYFQLADLPRCAASRHCPRAPRAEAS